MIAARPLLLAIVVSAASVDGASISPPNSASIPSRLWAPAAGGSNVFADGYPIGNGHVGALLTGGIPADIIVVNEDSRWSGNLLHRVNQDALETVREMQGIVREGDITYAQTLGGLSYVGTPTSTRNYMPIGFMTIAQNISGPSTDYERWLDIADSTAGVYFVHNGTAYQRDFFASYPDDVIAVHLTANKSGSISFDAHLDAGVYGSLNHDADYSMGIPDSNAMVMGGTSEGGANATAWVAGLTIVANGGRVYTRGDYVLVENADDATVYFSASTSYRKADPQATVLAALGAAKKRTYQEIRSAHVADYQQYASAFQLDLGRSTAAQRANTTSERMLAISPTAFDPELAALYVHYGRYMLISTSRNGTLPPNLQGIWNNQLDPMWGSKYTININLEMNYWPSLTTGRLSIPSSLPGADVWSRFSLTRHRAVRDRPRGPRPASV
jgi:alpha-L-fucosidase 2